MKKSIILSQDGLKTSDAQVVNFREIRMGLIAPNMLYRSSHPIKDNKQEKIIALLASSVRIAAILNLCDTHSEINAKAIFAPWYRALINKNQVAALGMSFSHSGENFRKKFKKGLQFIINTDGPWLIHCYAGVDRTGFFSMVLEALMGATVEEITNDYLLSFNSIFDSAIHGSVNKTDALTAMQVLSNMSNGEIIGNHNVQRIAMHYLRNVIRLSAEEVELLKSKLMAAPEVAGGLLHTDLTGLDQSKKAFYG